jgi:DNA-binding NarL/FixJ family response regulator
MIRFIIADNERSVRDNLKILLDAQPDIEVVALAASAEEAISKTLNLMPDVLLMDLKYPDKQMEGVSAIKRIRQVLSDEEVKILVYCISESYNTIYQAIEAGANSFVNKNKRFEEIADAVRLVASGGAISSPTIASKILERFREAKAFAR